MKLLTLAGASAAALLFATSAQSEVVVLTFPSAPPTCGISACNNGSQIAQTYGDTAHVDVSYRSITASTGATFEPFLYYWDQSYGNLAGVTYGGSNGTDHISEILFTIAPGFEMALISFDAACYLNRASCQTLDYGVSTTAQSLGGGTVALPDGGHTTVQLNTAYYRNGGMILRWGPDGYDVGLDNVRFDVRAIAGIGGVPEPTTWAMMILGFGVVGAALRRRKPKLTRQKLVAA